MAYVTGGKLISSGDMSGDITGNVLVLDCSDDVVSIQAIAASATHAGTLAVMSSVDGVNWSEITMARVDVLNGVALNQIRDLPLLGVKYLRPDYTRSSGVGTLNVTALIKQKSA